MKIIPVSILIFLISTMTFATEVAKDLAHPYLFLEKGEFTLRTSAGYYIEEREFEKVDVKQDKFEYTHEFYRLQSAFGLPGKRQFGVNVELQAHGSVDKEYAPVYNIPRQNVAYHGFHAVEVFIRQYFETNDDKDMLAFQVFFKGSPLKGKETNNTYQGKDIALSLFWSHLHHPWRVFGEVRSEILGRRKMRLYTGELETTDAYSQFGTVVGVQWLQDKFWFELLGKFYLTTDYNTRSKSYTRITDKGFLVGGKALWGYYLNPTTVLTLEHLRQSTNFNLVHDELDATTEFEIETQYTQLGITWLF